MSKTLIEVLPASQVVTDPVELITYEVDAGLDRGAPEGVVFPQSEDDVVRVARWATEHNVALIARGAGTGLSGGAIADRGGVIVEFSRMNRLLELDVNGRGAVVEPGILNLAVDDLVKKQGLYYPPDPASQRASTIGGNVAENAGGPHCFKYGVTTNYVTGLRAVLPGGRVVRVGGRALDYPEYDFVGAMVGSEGTLGLITSIDVRLVQNPPGVKTMMAVFDSLEQAGQAVSAVIAAGLVPATMEMMDHHIARIIEEYAHPGLPMDADAILIIETDGYPASLDTQIEEVADILQAHGGRGIRIAQSAEERERIWFARKSAAGAFSRFAPAYYLVDITVPRSRLAETLAEVNKICERYHVHAGHVFHAGDGNLHPLIAIMHPEDPQQVQDAQNAGKEMVKVGVSKDGSLTGEHGVGTEKRQYMPMMYTGAELAAMWDVKQVFDPRCLFNPGKVFPSQFPAVVQARNDGPVPGDPFTPTSAEQAAEGLAALSKAGRRVRIGSGDGADVRLSSSALTGVKAYAPDDLYVTVGAGTLLEEIQTFLARDRKQIPIASPRKDATIGGIVASNSNAPLRMRYGGIRDLVLAMTVALGDGRVIRAGRPVVKNVAGYDMPKIFIGSYGTLGLITDVTLKLIPQPRARQTLLVPVDDLARGLTWAEQLLPLALVASGIVLCKGAGERGSGGESVIATTEVATSVGSGFGGGEVGSVRSRRSQAISNAQLGIASQTPLAMTDAPYLLAYTAEGIREDVETEFQRVREVLTNIGAPSPTQVETPTATGLWIDLLGSHTDDIQLRIGIPPKDLARYVQSQTAAVHTGGFCADIASGLVYATTTAQEIDASRAWVDALRRPALELGGYAVVVHAPAALRAGLDRWGYQPETLDLMRALKARWDPAGILNPGEFVA